MLYSVIARFTAIPENASGNDDITGYCETGFSDIVRACRDTQSEIKGKDSLSFHYGMDGRGKDSEYYYLAKENEGSGNEFWELWGKQAVDFSADGILNSNALETFLCGLGACPEDVQTLGTLGGPLGLGIVPDILVRMEAPQVIESIRVTPFDPDWTEGYQIYEEEWERIREDFIEKFSS